jgi:hypothetical protein
LLSLLGVNELNNTKLEMIQKILPQMVNSEETVKFIDENLDDEEKLILRVTMGSLYNVFNGVYTGIYMYVYMVMSVHIFVVICVYNYVFIFVRDLF